MSFRHGLPPPRHPMFMGVPPPNMMSGPPPNTGNPPPPFFNNAPPPHPHGMHKHRPPPGHGGGSYIIQAKPNLNPNLLPTDHPSPFPNSGPTAPPVTVFVGNITEKWPDAMIRQLLSTCGYVLNWKRVQGASGKLQAFGFCEYGGPDAGLRAVRLLHDLEVGEKKLVVKVDTKTKDVFEEFKAERKKNNGQSKEGDDAVNSEDYMDDEMKEGDARSKMRISILFREFKDEIDSYMPPGTEKPDLAEKDPITKQAIQDKLHLLKLASLDAPLCDAETGDDEAVEEGKREIISLEIIKFREHMKIEKEKEEERKKISKERRERQLERENAEKSRRERDTEGSPGRRKTRDSSSRRSRSPSRSSDGPRSRSRMDDSIRERDRRERDRRGRSREERVERVARDRDAEREREWANSRRRSRERQRRSRSRSRSPANAPHKRRYREREEEEEAEDQRKQDKKAREKAAAYDERLRLWELREDKKRRDRLKDKDKQERVLEQTAKEARNMKEFFEDYDDEQLDSKYYKGKELQKRLADRTKELESDNRDRQREREEIEEMRLKVLTSGGVLPGSGVIPIITLDRQVKKPILDPASTSQSPSQPQLLTKKSVVGSGSVNARLQALAGQPAVTTPPQTSSHNNGIAYHTKNPNERRSSGTGGSLQTAFTAGQFNTYGPAPKSSNPSTPNSLVSPSAGGPIVEMSPSIRSLTNTGFTVGGINTNNDVKSDDDGTRNSFTPGNSNSPGMPDSGQFDREDDSSLQESPDFQKKKKMNVKDVFNQDEEDYAFGAKKRKLIPLDYGDANKVKKDNVGGVTGGDDKKKSIKSLIDRIPTEKDALFAYGIDWTMVDNVLMEKRIRPWINKKIVEYIGEPEPTLVDFICTKVLSKSNPATILDDVQMVLDDEAEVFVVKMWRLLVYEIEAKKIGLATASKA